MGLSAFNRARRLKAEKERQREPHTEYQGKMFDFNAMTDEQLSEYAAMKGVDISKARSREAVIAKLEKAEQENV